jgi:glycosyltransferase involved in cell wall biosynthesis
LCEQKSGKVLMPLISVIIPCYNDGIFLDDAIASLDLTNNNPVIEVIIINDGSDDLFTLSKLSQLSAKGIKVIHQQNCGLATARNKGIQKASGKYILPLDSDNKIVPKVFFEAANIMEDNADVDMVFTNAYYFGEKESEWIVGPLNVLKLLFSNYIDACTLIRKNTLLNLGMFDSNMPAMGNEDWELWINFFVNSKKMEYLPKIGFYYRIRLKSMSVLTTRPNFEKNREYIYYKYFIPNTNIFEKKTDNDKKMKMELIDPILLFHEYLFNKRFSRIRPAIGFFKILRHAISIYRGKAKYFDSLKRRSNFKALYPQFKYLRLIVFIAEISLFLKSGKV